MSDPAAAAMVGLVTGLIIACLVLVLPDIVSTWRYRRRVRDEQRERPDIPGEIERFELERYDGYWSAVALDDERKSLGSDTDTHPMDAVRNAINRTKIRKERAA